MSNTRYLEIVSSTRNRQQEQNRQPSQFTVLISQSGTRDKIHAYDPIYSSAPVISWKIGDLTPTVTTRNAVANPSNTTTNFIGQFTQNAYNKTLDYYVGLTITVGTVTNVPITGWEYINNNGTDDYFRIKVAPNYLTTPPTTETIIFSDPTTTALGIFFLPTGLPVDNFYNGYFLYNRDLNQWRTITSYDGSTKTIGVNGPLPVAGWTVTDTLELRKQFPQETGTLDNSVNPTTTTVTLPSTSSTNADNYVGNLIRIIGPPGHQNIGLMSKIIDYTGIGDLSPTGNNPVIQPRVATLASAFPVPPDNTQTYEILSFTRDNSVPFTYTGSLVSQQEMVCYEIELINLVLPNIRLKSGGRIAFYPYVYVEFQNVSGASAGSKNIIYSNNPNATRMMFRCAIDDIPNPDVSPFIKINGDGMVQTVKFKPNDNFKFGVYLPDGTPFETIYPESYSPLEPNPLIQISVLFGIKRL